MNSRIALTEIFPESQIWDELDHGNESQCATCEFCEEGIDEDYNGNVFDSNYCVAKTELVCAQIEYELQKTLERMTEKKIELGLISAVT